MENELYNRKWWDYRLATPDVNTMQFIYAYGLRFPSYNERLGNSAYINILRAFNINAPKLWSNWTTAQRFRQFCDSLGIKYDEFWNWACEEHEAVGNTAAYMNVFGTKYMMSKIAERRAESRKLFIPVSKHPFFMSVGYRNCDLQNEYYDFLLRLLKKRYGKQGSVTEIKDMIRDGAIPKEYFTRKE